MTSDDVKRIFQSSDNISQYINAAKLGEATVTIKLGEETVKIKCVKLGKETVKISCVKDFTICIKDVRDHYK